MVGELSTEDLKVAIDTYSDKMISHRAEGKELTKAKVTIIHRAMELGLEVIETDKYTATIKPRADRQVTDYKRAFQDMKALTSEQRAKIDPVEFLKGYTKQVPQDPLLRVKPSELLKKLSAIEALMRSNPGTKIHFS